MAFLATACGTTPTSTAPALTDPREIVTAALTSTESAKSVHLAATVNGEATVALPIGGGTGTPLDLTGTTASADIDFVKPAARATFAVKAGLTLNGEIIAVDGKTYVKSTLTGPLYEESAAGAGLFDPSARWRPDRQPRRHPAQAGRRTWSRATTSPAVRSSATRSAPTWPLTNSGRRL